MSLLLLFKSSGATATDGGSRSYFGWWLGGFGSAEPTSKTFYFRHYIIGRRG